MSGENEWENIIMEKPIKPTPKLAFIDTYMFPKKIQANNRENNAIGIDLGTSRCCAAVNRKNGITTVGLDNQGQRLLPSFVAFDEKDPKCGQVVVDRLRNFSNSTVFDGKRLIGKTFKELKVDNSWTFAKTKYEVEDIRDEHFLVKVQGSEGATLKYPEEISAALLKHIKQKSEEFQGKKLSEAVITIPAAFNEAQKQTTYDAALLAGWDKIHLLPEPVAAAFAYFADRPIPNNSTLLLFDLGGGTLDVCIFKIENNQLQIISNSGDPNTGGRDFDNLLIKYFERKLKEDFKVKISESMKYKFMQKCQYLKENLSILPLDAFDVEEIDSSIDAHLVLTRDEFEEMSEELLCRVRFFIETALDLIDYEPSQIDKVLQVGGGCRMPMIKQLLQDMFPDSEHCCQEHPEEVVAIGAAYYAYYMNQKNESSCSIM